MLLSSIGQCAQCRQRGPWCSTILSFARGLFARGNGPWKCGCPQRPSGQLRAVLPRVGPPDSVLQNGASPEPGGHDLLRLQCASLADDRVRTSGHRNHAAAHLWNVRFDVGAALRRSLATLTEAPGGLGLPVAALLAHAQMSSGLRGARFGRIEGRAGFNR